MQKNAWKMYAACSLIWMLVCNVRRKIIYSIYLTNVTNKIFNMIFDTGKNSYSAVLFAFFSVCVCVCRWCNNIFNSISIRQSIICVRCILCAFKWRAIPVLFSLSRLEQLGKKPLKLYFFRFGMENIRIQTEMQTLFRNRRQLYSGALGSQKNYCPR